MKESCDIKILRISRGFGSEGAQAMEPSFDSWWSNDGVEGPCSCSPGTTIMNFIIPQSGGITPSKWSNHVKDSLMGPAVNVPSGLKVKTSVPEFRFHPSPPWKIGPAAKSNRNNKDQNPPKIPWRRLHYTFSRIKAKLKPILRLSKYEKHTISHYYEYIKNNVVK